MVKLVCQQDSMVAIQIIHIDSGCQVHGVLMLWSQDSKRYMTKECGPQRTGDPKCQHFLDVNLEIFCNLRFSSWASP